MDEMMRELFTVGAAELKARGQTVKAGAIYGLDVMIEKDMQPVLLEVNFSPDCTRGIPLSVEAVLSISPRPMSTD